MPLVGTLVAISEAVYGRCRMKPKVKLRYIGINKGGEIKAAYYRVFTNPTRIESHYFKIGQVRNA